MFFVYILKSLKDGKYYIGHTDNLERRLADHNRGKSQSIRARGPFQIVYVEEHETRIKAVQREKQIKGWTRAKKLALAKGEKALLKQL